MKTILTNPQRINGRRSSLRCLVLGFGVLGVIFTCTAAAGKGKGGGGGAPPPTPFISVEYELAWLPDFGGGESEIHDINSAGIAVGRAKDASGDWHGFVSASAGMLTPLADYWDMPAGFEGGWVVARDFQINEEGEVCGIVSDAQGVWSVFLANLGDPASLVVLEWDGFEFYLQLNEMGDVAFSSNSAGAGYPVLYVRSADQIFAFPELAGLLSSGLNDQLQISLNNASNVSWLYDSYRLNFDLEIGSGVLEDLESNLSSNARSFARAIDNSGAVDGFSDNRKATAGVVAGGSLAWTPIDPALPSGTSSGGSLVVKASALDVNEFGQVLGGFDVWGSGLASDLWLKDSIKGLLAVDDLVLGDATDVATFQLWRGFGNVVISEVEPVTEFGIIAGTVRVDTGPYSGPNRGFILTPKLKP